MLLAFDKHPCIILNLCNAKALCCAHHSCRIESWPVPACCLPWEAHLQILVSMRSKKITTQSDLSSIQAGVKGTAITFLMTDNQIVNEKFLVYINDLLSTGYIADLCTQEDKDTFCNSVRGEVKQAGMVDSSDNCWDFFIDKVNSFLTHNVLATWSNFGSVQENKDSFDRSALLHLPEIWTHTCTSTLLLDTPLVIPSSCSTLLLKPQSW